MSHCNRIFVLLGIALALPGCWGLPGNGDRKRETRDLTDFDRIESHGELTVQVRQAQDYRVVVSVDSNLLDNVKTRVRDQTLIIDQNINFVDLVRGPHVIVEMPDLVFVHLYGSGDLDAETFDETDTIRLELSGSGDLFLDGSAPRIEAVDDGSGDIRLSGTSQFADLEVRGSGNIEARNLDAAAAAIRSDGSGDITATVHGQTDARIHGSGDIDLYGAVELRHKIDNGSGDIRVH